MTIANKCLVCTYLPFLGVGTLLLVANLLLLRGFDSLQWHDILESTLIGWVIALVAYTYHLAKNKWVAGPRHVRGSATHIVSFDSVKELLKDEFGQIRVDDANRTIHLVDSRLNRKAEVKYSDGRARGRAEVVVSCRHVHLTDVGVKNEILLARLKKLLER